MNPKVSIIILNWNGEEYLEDCLTSVLNQTYEDSEIIVVDNNSTDNSLEFIKDKFPKAEVIALEKNYGFAKGNNIGIKYALNKYNPNYVLLLNTDIEILDNRTLATVVEIAEQDALSGIVGCTLVYPDGSI